MVLLSDSIKFAPPLSWAQEQRCVKDLSSPNPVVVAEAKERLISSCLRYVYSAARRQGLREEDFNDLFATGVIGLVEAVERFDPSRGVRFLTYAGEYAKGKMRHFLRDMLPHRGLFMLPAEKQRAMGKLAKFLAAGNLDPNEINADLIGQLTRCSREGAEDLRRLLLIEAVQLDVESGENHSAAESIGFDDPGFDRLFDQVDYELLCRSLQELSDQDREIVRLVVIEDLSVAAAARALSLSDPAAKRRLHHALGVLYRFLSASLTAA